MTKRDELIQAGVSAWPRFTGAVSMRYVLAALVSAGLSGPAFGQFTPIGPFAGEVSEDWSSPYFPHLPTPCIQDVLAGSARMCASNAHITGSWYYFCNVFGRSAPWFYGSTGSDSTLTFLHAPAGAFGAYFSTNSGRSGGTATFLGDGGGVLGVARLNLPADCAWHWNGWDFAEPVRSIVIHNDNPWGGGWCMLDDMQFSSFGGGGCYPDCDTSTGAGVLDIFDFLCFQNRFAATLAYACDCDMSTGSGVCDIFDFLCFQNEFSAGCP